MKNNERNKKYLIAGLSFCLMISIAGYINYRYNPEREKDLGQTIYVNSNVDQVELYKEAPVEETFKNIEVDNISSFRYDRDNMYAELSKNYTDIINNENSSSESIKEYQNKLSELIEEKNKVLMIENIIKSKNIEDVVIIPNTNGKVNVILKVEEIDESLAAQVMQLLIDRLDVRPQDITIENI